MTRADEMETRFRTMLFRMIEAGWEIDYAKVEAEWARKVYVIPSTAPRKDPKHWLHEAVPMTQPRDPDLGWHALAAEVCHPVAETSDAARARALPPPGPGASVAISPR